MDKFEVFEMPCFEYTPQGFEELKAALKQRKIVRNPFSKFYCERVEVNVIQDKELKKAHTNKESKLQQ